MQLTQVLDLNGHLDQAKIYIERNYALLESGSQGNFVWQLRDDGISATAYVSGKVVIQGGNVKKIKNLFSELNRIFGAGSDEFFPHLGVDEAGKGDFFGPLVVAGVAIVDVKMRDKLLEIGVRDSKLLTNKQVLEMKRSILRSNNFVDIVIISPSKYDELYKKFKNVNKLLAWGHARVIENLADKLPDGVCRTAVIDQFSKKKSRVLDALMENGRNMKIVQKHGGESDIAVAAGSIVARGTFLDQMQKMGEKYDTIFPLGASNVIEAAQEFVKQKGEDALKDVAKISFKTTRKVLGR